MGHVQPPIIHHITQKHDVIGAEPLIYSSPALPHIEVGHYLAEQSGPWRPFGVGVAVEYLGVCDDEYLLVVAVLRLLASG